MKFTPKFTGKIKNNKVEFTNKDKFTHYLRGLEGREVFVAIDLLKNYRSIRQNNYLWGVLYDMLAREVGHTPEEWHEILKRMFLKTYNIDIKGIEFEITGSTTKLRTDEFEEYTEKIRQFAQTELNIYLPLPNEILDL